MSDVRAMLACLANEEVARLFASVVLANGPEQSLSPARKEKAMKSLVQSGLITTDDSAAGRLNVVEIRAALAALRSATSDGASPWLDENGRIKRFPRRPAERAEFLEELGVQVVRTRERISESELNDRLASLTDDIPTLRRYLVVHGVLDRSVDGSSYWRAATAERVESDSSDRRRV
ncbi:DUF2087 domain-containing protein [Microbacterium aurugineum]